MDNTSFTYIIHDCIEKWHAKKIDIIDGTIRPEFRGIRMDGEYRASETRVMK